jgi:alpha-acetolactate decarboxylase
MPVHYERKNVMCAWKNLFCGLSLLMGAFAMVASAAETWDGKLVQFGKMHEAIGMQQDQGRVELQKLVDRPHFYGVAALEKLEGEATIVDGKITLTRVDNQGRLEPGAAAPKQQATLLVGAYVPSWTENTIAGNVEPAAFDEAIANLAKDAGIKVSEPFVFVVEGAFSQLRLHVINGACPMHARLKKIELPLERQPAEVQLERVQGTLVGIFAKDAVGSITHPSTSTHMHLVFKDAASGETVTGHVEQIGMLPGAVVRLPKSE